MSTIHIDKIQTKIILNILRKYFPNEKFFVFGSRATQKNLKKFSDLDIAIDGPTKIQVSTLSKAAEEFSISDLPFKVDLVDLNSISTEFKKSIESDFVELTL